MKKKDFMEKSGRAQEEQEIEQFIGMMQEEMAKANITGFMNGVISTGQAMSDNMGPSSLAISVSLSDRYLQDFARDTEAKEIPAVVETEATLAQELGAIFDGYDTEPVIGARVADLLERVAGENPKIVRFADEAQIKEAASGYSKGWGPFYFMEDMFFVVFEDLTILIMLGNDE
mgnify:CR=1 FL=1